MAHVYECMAAMTAAMLTAWQEWAQLWSWAGKSFFDRLGHDKLDTHHHIDMKPLRPEVDHFLAFFSQLCKVCRKNAWTNDRGWSVPPRRASRHRNARHVFKLGTCHRVRTVMSACPEEAVQIPKLCVRCVTMARNECIWW